MTVSDIQRAEGKSRARAILMALMAAILVFNAASGVNEVNSAFPIVRHGLWAAMILLWLVILATGGGLRLSGRMHSLLNDEVALLNRSRALQAGFWAAMLGGLILYFVSLRIDVPVRDAMRILVDLTIAVALARYAWLELR